MHTCLILRLTMDKSIVCRPTCLYAVSLQLVSSLLVQLSLLYMDGSYDEWPPVLNEGEIRIGTCKLQMHGKLLNFY